MGDLLPIGDVPGHYARQFGPDRWALEHNGEVMTWAELERRANRRAWALAAQGVRDDDIVMLSLPFALVSLLRPARWAELLRQRGWWGPALAMSGALRRRDK